MGHLETALEKLRPIMLGSNTWDYCVVWKLGDDPSRFIEWAGCCCNGSGNQEVGNKRKKNTRDTNCRDTNSVHPVNTKSCQALATLPLFMPLHSGIHGEVVILGQSRWISVSNTPDSNASNQDLEGTRLLIPVVGGLVELFSTDNIPENEIIMEFVKSQFYCSETETVSNSTITIDEPYLDPLLENTLDTCLPSLNHLSILRFAQTLNQLAHTHADSIMGGSSTGSFPSPDSTPCSASQAMPFTLVKEESQGTQMVEKKTCKSKNLLTERNRRKRISDGMLKLRSLVPKITKMHKAATLSDAIDYINELENERLNLLDELQDSSNTTYGIKASYLYPEVVEPKVLAPLNPKQLTSSQTKRSISQVQVKVNQLGTGNYLIRVACQQSLGAFTKLLEAVGSLDVLIDDVNSTVYDDTMSSYFIVETKNKEIQDKDIRDSLMLLFA